MSDTADRHPPEQRQREHLEELFRDSGLSTFEMFRNFPVFTPRINLARFLAHYELFRRVVELPGSIVDLGVFRGGSTFTWGKLCEIFCPTDVRKRVYGFDTFSGFDALSPEDGPVDERQDRRPGGYDAGLGMLEALSKARLAFNEDRHLRHLERIEFIVGNVVETVPKFVEAQGHGLRVALLNLDVDLYEPTRVALEQFVPRMVRGGIIVCDEYAVDTFGGETKAIDDYFLATTGRKPRVEKFTWHSNPSAFIVIE